MFESRKRKKAEEEFQSRYNLTDDEMAQISFVKVPNLVMLGKGPKFVYVPQLTTDNFDLYKKINSLTPILEEKLNKAKTKFFDLTNKFNKKEIFDRIKGMCYEDLTDFLYNFRKNSEGIRISYLPDTPAEVRQQVWDKADPFLDAICYYYLLRLDSELPEYTKIGICATIKCLLKANQIDLNQNYDEIRSYIITRASTEAFRNTSRFEVQDWYNASIMNG